MSDFDSFFQSTDQLEGTDYTFRDADTLLGPDGKGYRIQGVDAPEVAKIDPTTGLPWSDATAGGSISTATIQQLANQHGFNNVVHTGDFDPNGREIIRLTNSKGQDFANTLLKTGVLDTNRYTNSRDVLSAEVGDLLRRRDQYSGDTDWDKARLALDEAITAETKYDAGFKQVAINEAERAAGIGSPGSVQFRHTDRTLENQALNPLSESLDLGLRGVQEAFWGIINLTGESANIDWAKDAGEAGVARVRHRIAEMPQLKLNAIDEQGNWDIDSVGQFFEYLGNNAAVSLPYMAITIAGSVAAPFTGGLSLAAPAAIYAGQTWNEQEGDNKNARLAVASGITQAVLDRIGLKGLTGSILNKDLRNTAINKIIKDSGGKLSRKEASDQLAGLTRNAIAGFADDAAKAAGQQITARNVSRALITRGALGAGTEGATEASQEAIGYLASHHANGFADFNANEFNSRIINAVVAGGTLGAGFSTAGAVYDVGAWADVAVRQAPAEAKRKSWAGHHAQQDIDEHGRVKSIQENNEEARTAANKRKNVRSSFEEKAAGHAKRDRGSAFDQGKELWKSIPGLWQRSTKFILPEAVQNKSQALRKLADSVGANLQRIYSGSNFEASKHHRLTRYKNIVTDPIELAKQAQLSTVGPRTKGRAELSGILNNFGKWVIANEKTGLDWDALPANLQRHRNWLAKYYNEVSNFDNTLWQDQAAFNPQLGRQSNYSWKHKSLNKAAIEKNRSGFIEALKSKGLTHQEAKAIADEVLKGDTINSASDFAVGRGRQVPGAHKARRLKMSEDPIFDEFLEHDFFNNLSNAAKSAARYVTYQEFLGDDMANINEMLEQALDEGVSEAEVNKIAAGLQDYFDAESGNYKRIENENWEAVQRNLMLWTTMAGLPLATVSSMVELALTTKGLTKGQIFGPIKQAAKEAALGIFDTMNIFKSQTDARLAKQDRQAEIKDLGYFNWEVGAATTTGVSQTHHRHQAVPGLLLLGLLDFQQFTEYTRSIRASIAGDFIFDQSQDDQRSA